MARRKSDLIARFSISVLTVCIADACCKADLFTALPGLSAGAQASLVAHYDGRTGVATSGNVVNSWTPIDGNGNALPSRIINSTQRGNGAASLITYDAGSGTLQFDDTDVMADGRYLAGALTGVAASTSYTVFWLGHYNADAPFDSIGTYAYNIADEVNHQRDDAGPSGEYIIELWDGSNANGGDDITAYDGIDTVWSTVYNGSTDDAYANGMNLNVTGAANYSVPADPAIYVGAFRETGFDLVGDIKQLIVFNSALSDSDRALVEGYLAAIPEPSAVLLFAAIGSLAGLATLIRRRVQTAK